MEFGKVSLVCGAGGFIGSHLVKSLVIQGKTVIGVDLKYPAFSLSAAQGFEVADLRKADVWAELFSKYEIVEVYQLAANMGGAGFVFTGEHDLDILYDSALINLNAVSAAVGHPPKRFFFSSSACVYPMRNQVHPQQPLCKEATAYPANPDSEYGWEKLFAERLYQTAQIKSETEFNIARFHNIFGSEGTWEGGREKAPAAFCRKIAEIKGSQGEVEVWGDGKQTRSFLHIDECLVGIDKLMESPKFFGPVNIGSSELVSINQLVGMIAAIAGKKVDRKHIKGPLGVRGRNSHNVLIKAKLGWKPSKPLVKGLEKTYAWVEEQVFAKEKAQ